VPFYITLENTITLENYL